MGSRQPRAAAEAWLAADPDPHTRAGLEALLAPADRDAGAAEELRRLFEDRLRFGTAGLRAPLGAGPARMNRVVVRSATAAVMATLPAGARVVVGHDARRNSDVFAADAAACVAAAGGEALVLGQVPTPVAAHAVVDRAADAGIVITASHNPPGDNGYKLYDAGGVQIVPPTDAAVEAHMAAAPLPPRDVPPPSDGGSIRDVGADAVERYLADIARRLRQLTPVGGSEAAGPPGNPSADRDPRRADVIRAHGRPEPVDEPLRVVYTPLHGVGAPALLALFERLGLPAPVVVASQAAPDGGFPTVAFPNPEEPGALDAAHALAGELGADLVIANDPDADRLAVAVPDGDGRRRLTGDELGALLADRLLRHPATGAPGRAVTGAPEPAAAGAPVSASAGAPEPAAAAGAAADDASAAGVAGKPALVATTVVSSQMLRAMASAAGVAYAETLTGFKWIARAADGRPERLLFGYEEALGYAVCDAVRDKDGISAAALAVQLAGELRAAGSSLLERLDELHRRHGVHATGQVTVRFPPAEAAAGPAAATGRLRAHPPAEIAGQRVLSVTDYAARPSGTGSEPEPDGQLPPTDMLAFALEGSDRVIVRPSGTEPKLKVYIETVEPVRDGDLAAARAVADRRLRTISEAMQQLMGSRPA